MSSAAYSAYGVCVVSLFWCHRCVNYISLHVESVMPMMVVEFQPLHNDGSIFKYIMYFNAMISNAFKSKPNIENYRNSCIGIGAIRKNRPSTEPLASGNNFIIMFEGSTVTAFSAIAFAWIDRTVSIWQKQQCISCGKVLSTFFFCSESRIKSFTCASVISVAQLTLE